MNSNRKINELLLLIWFKFHKFGQFKQKMNMVMSKIIAFLCILFFPLVLNAQEITHSLGENDIFYIYSGSQTYYGDIEITADARLKELVRTHLQLNIDREGFPGYRIQIFHNSGQNARVEAQQIQRRFERKFPDTEAYLDYQAPFFKVVVGNFRSRNEALVFHKEIMDIFPNSWVIEDKITFPKLD